MYGEQGYFIVATIGYCRCTRDSTLRTGIAGRKIPVKHRLIPDDDAVEPTYLEVCNTTARQQQEAIPYHIMHKGDTAIEALMARRFCMQT